MQDFQSSGRLIPCRIAPRLAESRRAIKKGRREAGFFRRWAEAQ
jgi:hypothetical protein